MVFITHDLQEALKLGDRIALMRDGRVVQLGTPEEIVGSPADDYVREFVRDVPREQVLTVRTAMRPAANADEAGTGPAIRPEATVSEAIEAVARAGSAARVMSDGRCLGVVDAADLLSVVAGTAAAGSRAAGRHGWAQRRPATPGRAPPHARTRPGHRVRRRPRDPPRNGPGSSRRPRLALRYAVGAGAARGRPALEEAGEGDRDDPSACIAAKPMRGRSAERR